jgi:hypothetical protein
VAPLGDDLVSFNIYSTVVGAAPNRVLAIEWVGATEYNSTGVFDLEVLLYETSNVIVTQLRVVTMGTFTSDGVGGINAGDGLRGQELYCAAIGGLPGTLVDVEYLPPGAISTESASWGGVKALYR